MAYEKRDEEFKAWLQMTSAEVPTDPQGRAMFLEAVRLAFNAGWAMRKLAEYEAQLERMRSTLPSSGVPMRPSCVRCK